MGVLIPFPIKNDVRVPEAPAADISPEKRRRLAEAHVLDVSRRLLQYYQSLGDWTPTCESQMVTAVRALMVICYQLTPVPVIPRGNNDEI